MPHILAICASRHFSVEANFGEPADANDWHSFAIFAISTWAETEWLNFGILANSAMCPEMDVCVA